LRAGSALIVKVTGIFLIVALSILLPQNLISLALLLLFLLLLISAEGMLSHAPSKASSMEGRMRFAAAFSLTFIFAYMVAATAGFITSMIPIRAGNLEGMLFIAIIALALVAFAFQHNLR